MNAVPGYAYRLEDEVREVVRAAAGYDQPGFKPRSDGGWFASYAPADKPEIVLVVFVRPGSGHFASTVAGRIYQDLYKPASRTTTAAGGQ